jgi:ABC-type Fe3+/spermidine/putrescine transport system ATPase subunit
VDLLELRDLLPRRDPTALSGGEKQKVALARAVAIRPPLLLLDEPLSALDPETRESLQLELERIHHELNITVIHVTHDFEEALVLGRHIAVIGDGKIRQTGTPEDIFYRPNSEFVARFSRMRNIFPGEFERQQGVFSVFRSGNIELFTTTRREKASHACVRPDDIGISLTPSFNGRQNRFTGPVSRIEERGMVLHVIVDVPPEVYCLVQRRKLNEMGLTIGQNVTITFDPDSVHVF